jgi:hypothetical protein
VVVDLLRQIRPDIPVLFLDTFHHFAETLLYRDELAARWSLNIVTLRAAEPSVASADEHDGLLRQAQGRPPVQRARSARHLVHRTAARAVAQPSESRAGGRLPAAQREVPGEDQSARDVDDEGCVELREGS